MASRALYLPCACRQHPDLSLRLRLLTACRVTRHSNHAVVGNPLGAANPTYGLRRIHKIRWVSGAEQQM